MFFFFNDTATTEIYTLFPTRRSSDLMMDVRERSVQFERDHAAGKDVIKIVDDETGEVIRQMPPEELLSFMRNLTKMLGNFLDERV